MGARDGLRLPARDDGAGALIYFTLPFEPDWLEFSSAMAVIAGSAGRIAPVAVALRAGWPRSSCWPGSGRARSRTWRAGTQMNGSEVATRVTGRVVRMEHQASGRIRLTLDLLATERPQLRFAPNACGFRRARCRRHAAGQRGDAAWRG
jgi:hypothetical protein